MPKIPGADYGKSAEKLALRDASIPMRVAKARSAAASEGAAAFANIYNTTDDIMTQEALRQVAKATPVYQESVKTSMVKTVPYDEEGKSVWSDSKGVFNKYQKAGLDAVTPQLTNTYAQQLFRQKALEIDSALIPQWSAKVKAMQQDDSLASYNSAEEAHLQAKQFNLARESVADSQMTGVRAAVNAGKILSAIDYGEYVHNSEIDVEASTLRDSWNGPTLVDARGAIEEDTKLSSADKASLVGRLESNMMNNFVDGFHAELFPVMQADGRLAAYEKGEELLKDFHTIPTEELGGDEHWRHKVYAGLRTAQAHYRDAVEKDSNALKLVTRIRNAHTGDQYNDDTLYNGGFNLTLGRDITEKGKWEQSDAGINDTELLENKNNSLFGDAYNYTLNGNRVPPVLESLLSATLETPRDEKQLSNALDFIGRLVTTRPEAITWQTKSTHIQDVATLTDFYGNDEVGRSRAYKMWKSWREVKNDKGKLAARNELASDLKAKQFFDDEFEGAIKAKYGANLGLMGLLDKGVGIKPLLKADSRAIYNKFMLMTGDPAEALAITTQAMRYTFGASKVGSGDLELKKYPIEKVVTSNVLDEDERADAINTQITDSLNQAGLPSDNFVVEAIDGMDPRFPQYLIKSFGESAMPSISLYAPELDKTAAYQGKMKARKLREQLTDQLAETKVLGAQNIKSDQEAFGNFNVKVPVDPDRDGETPERFRVNTLLKTQELMESLLGPTTTAEQRKQAAETPLDTDVQKENLLVDIDRRLRQDRFLSDVGGND